MRKGQTSVEFMILIGAIFLIFIPMIFLLLNYSLSQASDVTGTKVVDIAYKIADQSRELYYYGLYSKEIITIKIPKEVVSMSSYTIFREGADDIYESYIIINYMEDGIEKTMNYPIDIIIINDDVSGTFTTDCYGAGFDCYETELIDSDIIQGVKDIKIEVELYDLEGLFTSNGESLPSDFPVSEIVVTVKQATI